MSRETGRAHALTLGLSPGLFVGSGVLADAPLGLSIATLVVTTLLLIFFRGAPAVSAWKRVLGDKGDRPPNEPRLSE